MRAASGRATVVAAPAPTRSDSETSPNARVREGCLTMPDPMPESMFENVYVEPHPRIEEERREFAAYRSSFEGEEVPA